MTEADEEAIKRDNVGRYEEQKKDLLYKWHQKMGDDATLRNFVVAARDADEELADEVEKLPFTKYMYGDNLPMDQVSDGMRREVINVYQMMKIGIDCCVGWCYLCMLTSQQCARGGYSQPVLVYMYIVRI